MTLNENQAYSTDNRREVKILFDEEVLRQFDEIEGKVERLVEVCKSLRAANSELEKKVNDLEKKLREKAETERFYQDQRVQVRSKIDSLLNRLNNLNEAESF